MKLYCSILLILVLLWHNSVQAQDLEKTYRVQINTYVKEVDTNMVQSKYLKYLSKDYLAKVAAVTNDSIYMLCYFDDRLTNTEFGIFNSSDSVTVLLSENLNYTNGILKKAIALYSKEPSLANSFKARIAEINKGRVYDLAASYNYAFVGIKNSDVQNEALIIRIAVVHKGDFEKIFQDYRQVTFTSGVVAVPFKIRLGEKEYVDPTISIGYTIGASYQIPKSSFRFGLNTGILVSRVKVSPQTIVVRTNPTQSVTYEPGYYPSYSIPLIFSLENKKFSYGLLFAAERIIETSPIPKPYKANIWMGFSLGYRIF